MKIAVAGLGYVGLSNAVLLAQQHEVVSTSTPPRSTPSTAGNANHRPRNSRNIWLIGRLTCAPPSTVAKPTSARDYVPIATPSDYDPHTHCFNTQAIEAVIHQAMAINPEAVSSSSPPCRWGYTRKTCQALGCGPAYLSPEFLREGRESTTPLHPYPIVVGERSARRRTSPELLKEVHLSPMYRFWRQTLPRQRPTAFANAYLAMRVSRINELDTYVASHGLDSWQI